MSEESRDEDLARALSAASTDATDQNAWRQIFIHLWPFVLAVAWRRLRDRSTCEDIAQDVFIRLMQARPFASIADVRQFRAYVWRMTINVANDHVRRKSRQTGYETSADATITEAVPGTGFFDDPVLFSEMLSLARDELAPEEVRLLEIVLSGKTLRETATELGQSYGTTATRLFRLKGKLNKLLFP